MPKSSVRNVSVPKIYYGWVMVATAFAMFTVVFAIQYSFGIFFKPLQDSFGWSRAATSLAITLHLVVFSLGMVPIGWALDHFSPRAIFSAAALMVGAALVLASRVSEPWQLYLLWGLPLGIGFSACGPPAMGLVTRWSVKRRGVALGIASGGTGFGTLVGAPLANSLIASCGWRNAFIILGIAGGIILLVCAQLMRRGPPPDSQPQPSHDNPAHESAQAPAAAGMTFKQAILSREMHLILLAQVFAVFALRMIMVHIAPHATDLGITPSMAALAVGIIGAFSFTGRVVMGFVQDRIGPKRSMVICLTSQSATMLTLPFITSDAMFLVFAVIFGLTYGGDLPQIPAIAAECFGMASISLTYGLIMSVSILGGSIGPIVGGWVYDATGSYTAIFLAAAVGVLVGALLLRRLNPRYRPSASGAATN